MDYFLWESMILSRMAQPSPVFISMWGDYTADGSGTIYAKFRNDSTATISGKVILVITEDSLFYQAPNGMDWHNHVPRDYLPDEDGFDVSIAPGDSVTVSQPFDILSEWDENFCRILTWIQDTVMQTDTIFEIWQGGMVWVTELGIEEEGRHEITQKIVNAIPNPCFNGTDIVFSLPRGTEYRIDILDVTGRRVKTLKGIAKKCKESVRWNRRDEFGSQVGSGVYLYRFESKITNTIGKIVVR